MISRFLGRIDRARGGLVLDAGLYAVSAAFALVTGLTSTLLPHRAWGLIAFWAYLGALVVVGAQFLLSRPRSPGRLPLPSRLGAPGRSPVLSRPRTPVLSRPRTPGRLPLTWAAWAGAAILPLVVEAVQRAAGRTDRAQDEVLVVERMGERLLHTDTPYLSPDAILALPAPDRLLGYAPYQPGMAVFGLPRAVVGAAWWIDARVWFALVTGVALIAALRALATREPGARSRSAAGPGALPAGGGPDALPGDSPAESSCGGPGESPGGDPDALPGSDPDALPGGPGASPGKYPGASSGGGPGALIAGGSQMARAGVSRPLPAGAGLRVRALQAATVLPICALTLATGGDDIPVLALCLLALACCATDRFGRAGLAVGAAAACKLFAFPVIAALAVLAVVTGHGRRFLPGAVGLPVLVLVPPMLVDGNAFVENVIRFPLGHGIVTSPAQSPFPGYLIATGLPGGHYLASGLLVAAGLAIAVLLVRRPPRTAATAALFCGYGLLAAILLMPTTRFGYLLYPIALLVWSPALRAAAVSAPGEVYPPTVPPPGRSDPPPNRSSPPPGRSSPPPGRSSPPPGRSNPPPGRSNPPPGRSSPPPGRSIAQGQG